MDHPGHPFLVALLAENPLPFDFIQIHVAQEAGRITLRHQEDTGKPASQLRAVGLDELARLADVAANGAFRPNKAAPNLQKGWLYLSVDRSDMHEALEQIYPGALADWYAARQPTVPCTSFREFIQRQTGIYRGIRSVSDPQAADIVRASCSREFCLRRRWWSVPGLDPDPQESKSLVPCLDPCGLLLESARRRARLLQEPVVRLELAQGDLESLEAALTRAIEHPAPEVREGDSANPANPRRLLFLLNQLRSAQRNDSPVKEA